MTEPIDMLNQLFDSLDIAVDSAHAMKTGDLPAKKGAQVMGGMPAGFVVAIPPQGPAAGAPPPGGSVARPPQAPQPIQGEVSPQALPSGNGKAVAPAPAGGAPAAGGSAPQSKAEVDAYFARQNLYAQACKELHAGNYPAASAKLERLIQEVPSESEFQAAACFARFKLAATDAIKLEELKKSEALAEQNSFCITSKIFAGRINVELGKHLAAVRYLKAASDMAPDRSDVLLELRRANELLNQIKVAGSKDEKALKAELAAADTKMVWTPFATLLLLYIVLAVVMVIPVGLGKSEHLPYNGMLAIGLRIAMLLVFGIVGTITMLGKLPFKPEDLGFSKAGAGAALGVGVVSASILSTSMYRAPIVLALAIGLFRVLGEEAVFRVMLGRALNTLTGNWRAPLFSALLYGLYQCTFYSLWFLAEPGDGAIEVAKQMVLVGLPCAILHQRTRSLLPPVACHLVIGLGVMLSGLR